MNKCDSLMTMDKPTTTKNIAGPIINKDPMNRILILITINERMNE